ncbi:hypothetical protein GOBAR_DD11986 [Gossypium barbadense]|nr:hypothetical protein GOBAR_DD11986 [Gossypium barbadense]
MWANLAWWTIMQGGLWRRCSLLLVQSDRFASQILTDSDLQNRRRTLSQVAKELGMWESFWGCLRIVKTRGIGAKIKYKVVRLAVVLNKLDTNCLHGSKMVSVKDQKIRSLWPYDVFGFSFSPSIGRSRGLLAVWDIDSLSVGSKIYMLRVL